MPRRYRAALTGIAVWLVATAPARSTLPPPRTRVVMLGTGTPNSDPERSGPAVAIVVGDAAYLVDAGPGIVRRAALAMRVDSLPALDADRLRRVFLTHLHSDHTTGLPDLIFSPWVLGRSSPIDVYGPPGTARMVDLLEQAYSEDVAIRLRGGEPSNKSGYAAHAHEVTAGEVYRDRNMVVRAFDVPHGAWEHALGYVFTTADRTIVVSGDTRPSDAIVRACQQCDVLVHEVYDAEAFKHLKPDWQAYHSSFHTSTYALGDLAARARPKLLVLYHQLYWGGTDSSLVSQVKTRFSGPVVSARDLGMY